MNYLMTQNLGLSIGVSICSEFDLDRWRKTRDGDGDSVTVGHVVHGGPCEWGAVGAIVVESGLIVQVPAVPVVIAQRYGVGARRRDDNAPLGRDLDVWAVHLVRDGEAEAVVPLLAPGDAITRDAVMDVAVVAAARFEHEDCRAVREARNAWHSWPRNPVLETSGDNLIAPRLSSVT